MNRYRIELSEEQMLLVSRCLEDISRFAGGQYELRYTIEEMLYALPLDEHMERRKKIEDLLLEVKKILFPDLAVGQSLIYDSTDFIGNVYQIYRSILHRLAVDNKQDNMYSYPALPSGNMGRVTIEKITE
jgi:hypothetical protein